MPQHLPALAARAAVATSAGVLALSAVLSASATEPAAPGAAPETRAYTRAAYVPVSRTAPPAGTTVVATAVVATATAAAAVPMPAARSASALSKAMSKIGSPYRWGASGPSAFDCSGLVSWAYKQVGVKLPRSSNAMSKVGRPVSRSQLQPGDLVFFYKPVSHVAMYVGNGKVVHASTSSQPVKISNLAGMPFSGARRV